MKLIFCLKYKTSPGEKLYAVLYRQGANPREHKIGVPLASQDGITWQGQADFLLHEPLHVNYHYELRSHQEILRQEWVSIPRRLELNPVVKSYFLLDQWRDLPQQSWLYTTCMTRVFRKRSRNFRTLPLFRYTLMLRVQTPRPEPDEELCICGSCQGLGNWSASEALPLTEYAPNEWQISLNAKQLNAPFEYKFLIRNARTGKVYWEEGPNRLQETLPLNPAEILVCSDLRPQFPADKTFRAAGVVLPVFSLRSEGSWGVGDFGDLKKLTDWAVSTGQKVIQILPIHDTNLTGTREDSYPYKAISIYAFHPLYADMRQLPALCARQEKLFEKKRRRLNALDTVDYECVLQLKLKRLHLAFEAEGERVLASVDFLNFWRNNAHWLPAYAMFCVLRDKYHTADFSRWDKYHLCSEEELRLFCQPGSRTGKQVLFWYYVQFILHTQLLNATTYARKNGLILKGDVPIGISPHSVEAWAEPTLFNLTVQAGAPPDDFSPTGQNWGFPTYNWQEMSQNRYRWWTNRFNHMARYVDAYRIDHVLGFFRIWEIPSHAVDGLLGQFAPALPFSAQEMAEYGFAFDPCYARPYISQALLEKQFGKQAKKIAKKFLLPLEKDLFQLHPSYATQRQIQAALPGQNEKTVSLRRELYALAANVLFVQDRHNPHKFHPRIAALSSSAFEALSPAQKQAFTELYNDYFFRRHNTFWEQEALNKLPALTQCTRMLCCAEDLGMIPTCVPPVMQQLQMLSLEIQRMPKEQGQTFADTQRYPYLSVATPSTHDMSVLRSWWKENKQLTQQFWTDVLHQPGAAPAEADGKTCEDILRMHLQSPSMLCLISFQDWTSMDENLRAADTEKERINIPANPHHYWCYRMHLTLENLLEKKTFNDKIKEMITQAKR